MQLKRGIERVSCDFCHRRKIKCDRSLRISRGYETCSQCKLRQASCSVDDSDDIRLRKRRQANARQEAATTSLQGELRRTENVREGSSPAAQPASQNETAQIQNANASVPLQDISISQLPCDYATGLPFLDDPFELSLDGSNLLDHIILSDSALGNHEHAQSNLGSLTNICDVGEFSSHQPASDTQVKSYNEQYSSSCDIDSTTFSNALHAYFQFAAISLPIIFEDAFWQDYQTGRCSRSLVFAIASHGMPFTSALDKWEIQQRTAKECRQVLLESGSQADEGPALSRLDDLEALALMVDFEYENTDRSVSSLQANLERMLLTHDSLVVMTLQFSRKNSDLQDSHSSTARFGERRTLLLWHVYGIDAFRVLDRKGVSRISDQEVDVVPGILKHTCGGYIDAILALAIVARRIVQTLCTVSTRLRGVERKDLLSLYAQLESWQQNVCPLSLRKQRDQTGKLLTAGAGADSIEPSVQLQLHRALVWLLEINCYMQIDSIVSEFGIQDEGHLESEILALRVESETMRAAQDVVDLAWWMGELGAKDTAQHSLVDLSPILCNICAGTCVWVCARGQKIKHLRSKYKLRCGHQLLEQGKCTKATDHEHIANYGEMATRLRNTVATATSHQDTGQILRRLDDQLLSLDASLGSSVD